MTNTEPTTIQRRLTCTECKAPFEANILLYEGKPMFVSTHCPLCAERRRIAREDVERRDAEYERARQWRQICPVEMRLLEESGETDLARLKQEHPEFDRVLAWRYGKRGLLLTGPSGTGKTRIAWRLIRREFNSGRQMIVMKGHRFTVECQSKALVGRLEEWLNDLVSVPLLFIDDFGKGKLTEHVESALFGLIDERTEANRPMIITTNDTGASLAGRMSDDRAAPLVRRLREYCDAIVFTR